MNKKIILYVIAVIIVLIAVYAGLSYISYMFSQRIIFGINSCIIEKKVEFGRNVIINDCGHNLDLQIDRVDLAYFINLTSFKVDGEDYIKKVNEGDPVKIIIHSGTVNFRIKPDLVFGKKQGIIFMPYDAEHKDWTIWVRSIDNTGATLLVVHGYI